MGIDGELVMVPGGTMPEIIQQPLQQQQPPIFETGMQILDINDAAPENPPKRKPARKWFKQWVAQDTVLSTSNCHLLKWINDDTMNLMKSKQLDGEQEADSEYEVVYVCTFENCGKVFTEAPALRKHAHVHGEKQYICHYEGCGKRFVDSSKLKRHFLIHTGEKHFTCRFCGKAFSLDFNLRSHMRTHTGENYHTCPYEDCGRRYAHEYKLRGHLKRQHDKVFPEGKQISLPLEIENPKVSPAVSATGAAAGRPFACPYEGCDKRYFYEYKLNLHKKKAHVKEELVEQNGSDEFSEGSDPDNGLHSAGLVKGSGKGKLRITSKTPRSSSKKKKAAVSTTFNQKMPAVDTSVGRKAVIKHEIQEDSEETEDEGRDDMDEDGVGNEGAFDDEEETEDDME